MKHLLLTTIAAVFLVGCGPSETDRSLLDAAEKGNIKAVKQAIVDGADVDAKDSDGWTPLHNAALKGHKEIFELLIAKGADVNAKGSSGWTPLHFAANGGYMEVAKLLIAKGVDVNAKTGDGVTPLDRAEDVKNWQRPKTKVAKKETADLLRKHGGKTGEELK
ncbi:MAG: ankyrin repeat domain-containing protein [Verrucomicrobia bacterium]|jgi:ankyrin repeat protein|nr:ankyrin repeat domain-containing protein [Verrucomicrobiota bacterium]